MEAVTSEQRSKKITLGGTEYELLLTTNAVMEITQKYGGLSDVGEKLAKASVEEQFEMVMWLIALMANQPLLRHNRLNPNDTRELIDEEYVALMTTPRDILDLKDALLQAMTDGVGRNVESEPETPEKNPDGE